MSRKLSLLAGLGLLISCSSLAEREPTQEIVVECVSPDDGLNYNRSMNSSSQKWWGNRIIFQYSICHSA